jgi:hypothetical protein
MANFLRALALRYLGSCSRVARCIPSPPQAHIFHIRVHGLAVIFWLSFGLPFYSLMGNVRVSKSAIGILTQAEWTSLSLAIRDPVRWSVSYGCIGIAKRPFTRLAENTPPQSR